MGNEYSKKIKGPMSNSELSRGRSQQKMLRSSKELGIRQRDHGLTKPKEEEVSNKDFGDEC